MVAFVANGPDIPDRLSYAHEEGQVVFFCGAGISYPAKLPSFKGLVDAIHRDLNYPPNAIQKAAIKSRQFDTAIGLLEADIAGGREKVRGAIARVLTPINPSPNTATHAALLTLARNRDGRMRLITTNFDRLFEAVIENKSLDVERFNAPLLPIPKNRWDGLVYLHGLLPSKSRIDDDDPRAISELDRLVVSSGDFGLAYLTERWAARFVSELLRNYTVCFVGYSIDDPVLRYMMDALAADRLLGETPREMFAFGSYSKGKQEKIAAEWQAKNVTPILYREHRKHIYLHKTLHEWANTYRDGVQGKKMIIAEHASSPPLTPSRSDFAVGRVLWALTDEQAAKHFADLNPVPPLKWLEPLTENQFRHRDLSRFGIVANSSEDEKLHFSALYRPAPYTRSPSMCIVNMGPRKNNWDEVMYQLARWLIRHLDDPDLIHWLAETDGRLQEQFAGVIRSQIERLEQLEIEIDKENNKEELNRIRANAPKAIPGPLMRTLWRLLLAKRITLYADRRNLYDWLHRIKQDGVTPSLRIELKEILTPRVRLRPCFNRGENTPASSEPLGIKDIVDWELVLSSDHVHYAFREQKKKPEWQIVLPDLLQSFTVLLRDALDLAGELGGVGEKSDLSYIHQPSISEHSQNRGSHDWTALIELTRDAWLATVKIDYVQARRVAEDWWQVPYPVFKRLALFAATQNNVISHRQVLDWLLEEDCWWLCSVETERELLRLLVVLTPKLDASKMAKLEHAILKGPPRKMFKNNLEQDEWVRIVDRTIWLRLAKVQKTRAKLSQIATTKLDELVQKYSPHLKLAEDESDEFPFWMEDGEKRREFFQIPQQRLELVEWLKGHANLNSLEQDEWRKFCRDNFPTAACALCALTKENVWLASHWRVALQTWSEDKLIKRSWRYMGLVLDNAPDDFVQLSDHALSWWLQAIARTFQGHETIFLNLCHRILKMDKINYQEEKNTRDPVGRAINHPVGQVVRALLDWWYREPLKDGQGLSTKLKPIFTKICDTKIDKFCYGRVLLAAHVIALYRIDSGWTIKHLLPLFDWQRSENEARFAWEGFLWSPRLYRPLLSDIKEPILETAKHYTELKEQTKQQYADFLAFVALDRSDIFTINDLKEATESLPQEGLENTAHALIRAFEGAGDQRGEYWDNRLLPYIKEIWPKSQGSMTPRISWEFAHLCIVAGKAFPEALKELWPWFERVEDPYSLVHFMHEEELCKQFPEDALKFLSMIVNEGVRHLPKVELQKCLSDIQQANQELAKDDRFIRLNYLNGKCGI